jgi:hypothetical protein
MTAPDKRAEKSARDGFDRPPKHGDSPCDWLDASRRPIGRQTQDGYALPSKRAESGLLHVHPLRDKPRRKPWRVEVWRDGRLDHVATMATPAEGVALAAIANRLREYAPDLPRRAFRQTSQRLADDHASGQLQLPLGDGFEALPDGEATA